MLTLFAGCSEEAGITGEPVELTAEYESKNPTDNSEFENEELTDGINDADVVFHAPAVSSVTESYDAYEIVNQASYSEENHSEKADEPANHAEMVEDSSIVISKIALKITAGNEYLIEIYSNGRVIITRTDFAVFDRDAMSFYALRPVQQVEVMLMQHQLDSLLNDINDFIDETLEGLTHYVLRPPLYLSITAMHDGRLRELYGGIVMSDPFEAMVLASMQGMTADEWLSLREFEKPPMAERLMETLREISPITLIFSQPLS